MTRSTTWAVCVGMVALTGLGVQAAARRTPDAIGCGPLRRWRLPEAMIVERSRDDARSADVLLTQARLDAIIRSAEIYCQVNNGQYPHTFEQMVAMMPRTSECALEATDLVDAWDQPIFYAVSAGRPILWAAGEDGRFTTSDDIGWPTAADAHTELFELPTDCLGP